MNIRPNRKKRIIQNKSNVLFPIDSVMAISWRGGSNRCIVLLGFLSLYYKMANALYITYLLFCSIQYYFHLEE